MGNIFTMLMDKLAGRQQRRILMVGLDAAGKTTILYKLRLGDVVETMPTIGCARAASASAAAEPAASRFNVETVQYKKLEMQVWDVGGQDKIRQLWRHYYNGTDAVIFVVDSADTDRLSSDTGDSAAYVSPPPPPCRVRASSKHAGVGEGAGRP